jgi:hypothetical protein
MLVTNLTLLARTAPTYTCVKHQQTTEEIHQSKPRLLTACTAISSIPNIVIRTILITTSTLQTPTWTIPILYIIISNRSSCSSGAFQHGVSPQPGNSQPKRGAGNYLWVKQDPQNPRKARKRHKKKRPKPSPHSTPGTVAERAQIKETQQPSDHSPTPLTMTMMSVNKHKKKRTQGSLSTPKKAEHVQPTETQQSTIHPPYPLTMESVYRWYSEQGRPTANPDFSWTPTVPKAHEEAEATISSESDSDSHYSDCFESAEAREGQPLRRSSIQSKHAI